MPFRFCSSADGGGADGSPAPSAGRRVMRPFSSMCWRCPAVSAHRRTNCGSAITRCWTDSTLGCFALARWRANDNEIDVGHTVHNRYVAHTVNILEPPRHAPTPELTLKISAIGLDALFVVKAIPARNFTIDQAYGRFAQLR